MTKFRVMVSWSCSKSVIIEAENEDTAREIAETLPVGDDYMADSFQVDEIFEVKEK